MEEHEPAAGRGLQRYTVELPALLRLVGRSALNFLRIRRIVGDFQAHFREHYGRWSALDFRAMAAARAGRALPRDGGEAPLGVEGADHQRLLRDGLLRHAQEALRLLVRRRVRLAAERPDLRRRGASRAPSRPGCSCASPPQARQKPELRQRLLDGPPEDLAARRSPPIRASPDFAAEIARYLDLYGFRCVNELKLEEPSLRDRPAFLYQILRNYLAMDDPAALDVGGHGGARAGHPARRRGARLRRHPERPPAGAAIFRRVLEQCPPGSQEPREPPLRPHPHLRPPPRAAARRGGGLRRRGPPRSARTTSSISTLDEVWDYIRRAAPSPPTSGASPPSAAKNSTPTAGWTRPADRFETFGLPYHRNRFQGRPQPAPQSPRTASCAAPAAAPASSPGPVKVLRTPSEDARLDGEILVAERTDPGWVPLYPSVSGLLIERGSILSHSAIVAREMGIPTIVGIAGLVETLKTGQVVTMDGGAGTVRLDGAVRHADARPHQEPS